MAELAIPLIALGSLYIYSNKDREKKRENFENIGMVHHNSKEAALPNTEVLNENFPIKKSIDVMGENYTRQYLNPNQTTDRLFDRDKNVARINSKLANTNASINSMSGNEIDLKEFKHNNMVPFFRGKVTGASSDRHSESILDNRIGSGSQMNKRVEQAPLFSPSENMQNVFGTQNNTDFIQSRQMPSTKISNVLPWEQEKVAPGLGLGFTSEGSNGFNSGMMQRDSWKPPTVDDLRSKTNPRETFTLDGHQGPAESKVVNSGIIGNVEKNKQNTMFEMGSDRWFTSTNGLGQTHRSQITLPESNRMTTTNEYFGPTSDGGECKQNYYRGKYEPCARSEIEGNIFSAANATTQGNPGDMQMRSQSFKLLNNNRNDNCQPDNIAVGGMNGTFRAILAPIIDVLKPTRKENVIGNANQTGNVTAIVPNLPISNPEDRPKTTIKEMTVDRIGLNHLNVSQMPGASNAYVNSQFELKDQERNVGDYSSFGNIQGQSTEMNRAAWDNQHNNVNKTNIGRPNPGGMDVFNGHLNVNIARNENDRVNIRAPVANKNLPRADTAYQHIPSGDTFGKVQPMIQLSNDMNNERMNPDLLSAFKSNPYAQSLNSY